MKSPFATLAISIPLAGALLGYVKQKTGRAIMTETAMFHFAGDSSTGKTTLGRLAASVYGSPDSQIDYDASDRGAVELAYRRNHLAVVIDDVENLDADPVQIFKAMKKLSHHLARGRSKAISQRAVKGGLPDLKFEGFGVSGGPTTFAAMAKDLGARRQGDQVRILDTQIPRSEKNGIFGAPITASGEPIDDSGALIKHIENTIEGNHGILLDAWIKVLLKQDLALRAEQLVAGFVQKAAGGEDGLEQRFAKKFAVPYAAAVLGVEAGLLPWPADWPLRAIGYCYRQSRLIRDPEGVAVKRVATRLTRALDSEIQFPRVRSISGKYPRWNSEQIGFHFREARGATTWMARDRLHLVNDAENPVAERLVLNKLIQMKLVEAGNNATSSRQFRVRLADGAVAKVRLWRVNRAALRAMAPPRRPAARPASGPDVARSKPQGLKRGR
jgi:Domain of unknown function (DUF927)